MKITREDYPFAVFAFCCIAMVVILLIAAIADAFACGVDEPEPAPVIVAPALRGENQ
jgi:hypothetical protein